jgi:hypothetical protein
MPPAFELIAEGVHRLVAQSRARLSFGLGYPPPDHILARGRRRKAVIAALNLAYGATE